MKLFRIINYGTVSTNLYWKDCTAGDQAMSNKCNSLQELVMMKSPGVFWTHSIIHWEALASKLPSLELNIVLSAVIDIVNYKKTILKIKDFCYSLRRYGKLNINDCCIIIHPDGFYAQHRVSKCI